MNIEHVREFVVFSEYLNFTAAAKELYITQPALSGHVASLERELGINLIEHGSTPVLTNAGRELVKLGIDLVAMHDAAVHQCIEAAKRSALVCVWDFTTRGSCKENFDIFINKFLADSPNVYLENLHWDSDSVFELLSDNKADCVVVYYSELLDDANLGVSFRAIPNYTNGQLAFWMSKQHPLANFDTLSWDCVRRIRYPQPMHGGKLNTAAIKSLGDKHGVSVSLRKTPEDGWNFLKNLYDDDVLVLDTGYFDVRPFAINEDRVLKVLEGEGSESIPYLAFLDDNKNPALLALLTYLDHECEIS